MPEEKKKEAEEVKAPESPESPKKRTQEQFDKLKKSNQELKEEKEKEKKKREELEKQTQDLLESLRPEEKAVPQPTPSPTPTPAPSSKPPSATQYPHLSQPEVDKIYQELATPDGMIDGNKLLQKLSTMNRENEEIRKRALLAEQAATQATRSQRDFEEKQKMREVHKKYPQLNPKSKEFDKDFFDAVRNELIGQMIEGKEDVMVASDKWYNRMYGEKEVKKADREKLKVIDEKKRQINASTPSFRTVKGYYKDYERDQLIQDVKTGKKGALAERLRRSGN